MNKILEGKLILLASHNPLDIDLLCDCVYELRVPSRNSWKKDIREPRFDQSVRMPG